MATTREMTESVLSTIERPTDLSERQIDMAVRYVKAKMAEGFTIGGFCKDNALSTKTFYAWLEIPNFKKYINDVQGAITPDDERQAFKHMKNHIMRLAYKDNPALREIELFTNTFPYLFEIDKQETMERLGLNKDASSKNGNLTNDEKREALLARLKSK